MQPWERLSGAPPSFRGSQNNRNSKLRGTRREQGEGTASLRVTSTTGRGRGASRDAYAAFIQSKSNVISDHLQRLQQVSFDEDTKSVVDRRGVAGQQRSSSAQYVLSAPPDSPSSKRHPVAVEVCSSSPQKVTVTEEASPMLSPQDSPFRTIVEHVWCPLGIVDSASASLLSQRLDEWWTTTQEGHPAPREDHDDVSVMSLLWGVLHRAAYYCRRLSEAAAAAAGMQEEGEDSFSDENNSFTLIALSDSQPRGSTSSPRRRESSNVASFPSTTTRLTPRAWLFTLSSISDAGYPRLQFYAQTPEDGSIFECLAALVWLTRRFRLSVVAVGLRLRQHAPFLFSHTVAAVNENGEATVMFPKGDAWPPSSSLQDGHGDIIERMRQVRYSQLYPEQARRRSVDNPSTSDHEGNRETQSATGYLEEPRGALRLRRLLERSVDRTEALLCRRAVLLDALGPTHSPHDYVLSHQGFAREYAKVMKGLAEWESLPKRAAGALDGLRVMGDILSALARSGLSGGGGALSDVFGDIATAVQEDIRLEGTLSSARKEPTTTTTTEGNGRGGGATGTASPPSRRPSFRSRTAHLQLQDDEDTTPPSLPITASGGAVDEDDLRLAVTGLEDVLKRYQRSSAFEYFQRKESWMRRRFSNLDDATCQAVKHGVHQSLFARYSFRSALAAEMCCVTSASSQSKEVEEKIREPAGVAEIDEWLKSTVLRQCHGDEHVPQTVLVGPPAPGRTTSAQVELERLRELLLELAPEDGASVEDDAHRADEENQVQGTTRQVFRVQSLKKSD